MKPTYLLSTTIVSVKILLLTVVFLAPLSNPLSAQRVRDNGELQGYWTGAFIRGGNSMQALAVDFYMEADTLRAASSIPDWAYYDPRISVVKQEGNVVRFNTYYGEVTLVKDSAYAELIGECNFANVHLKKSRRPARRKLETIDTSFQINGITSGIRITKPAGPGSWPAILLVHGRGCGTKDNWDRRPEVLAEYGLVVVSYDKRGSRPTAFPCEKTTMDMHSADLARITEKVSALPYVSQLGYMGFSAGGWLSPKAAAETSASVDFMITVVGPSTSVKQQQLDCSEYYLRDQLGLGAQAIKEAKEYTSLMFETNNPQATYDQMMNLLDAAELRGWRSVLESDDIPASPETMGNMWVRRNTYDPAEDLKAYNGPFLSLLGGNDFIVPYRENRDRFVQLFEEAGKKNYEIVIVSSAGHGMEHGHKPRDLGYQQSIKKWPTYFKFDRVAPGVIDEVISFLRQYEIIE
jgi:dienelactone hydrolase